VRLFLDKHLDKNTKFCYTYDELSRVTARTVKKLSDNSVVSTETFTYDAAGNITDAPESCFQYDTNNRLIIFNGNAVTYDPDGNMLSNSSLSCTYDSANRLITAGGHTYTYNAEDVRIRNLCESEDTTYTYNTNAKLSMLLMKTTGGVVTKYVYGKGLIGEESNSTFKTYHFDCRGSTIAITDTSGNITDTFAYDTYGKIISRTGTSKVIFGYNGRDGVITDDNELIYMRARYYSPDMKRFVNADIVAGELSKAITLNRFAYANGNPVSFVDPFGLFVGWLEDKWNKYVGEPVNEYIVKPVKENIIEPVAEAWSTYVAEPINKYVVQPIRENVYEPANEFMNKEVVQPTLNYLISNAPEPIANLAEDVKLYDKDNTNEQKVLNSHYFSSYKGKLVIRTNMDRSGSFGILFITHETNNRTNPEDVIRHEYGHTKQLDQIGIVNYALFIGLPSWQEWSSDSYYDRPWEVTADTYGGVQSRTPAQAKIDAGEGYLDIIKSDAPIWNKISQLQHYYN